MRKQLMMTSLAVLLLCHFCNAAKMPDAVMSAPVANALNLIYTSDNGNIALDNRVEIEDPDNSTEIILRDLTSFQITSQAAIFIDGGDPEFETIAEDRRPSSFDGLFDVYQASKTFKLVPDGFGGSVIETFANIGSDRDPLMLLTDFEVDGSFLGGGSLDDIDVFIVVPEPISVVLSILVAIFCLARIRSARTR